MDKPIPNQHKEAHGRVPITYAGLTCVDIIATEENNKAVADELKKITDAIERPGRLV